MTVIYELDAFGFEQSALNVGTAKCETVAKPSVLENNSVTRYVVFALPRCGIIPQCESDIPPRLGASHQLRDKPISGHVSLRNLAHDAVNLVGKLSHCRQYNRWNAIHHNNDTAKC